MKQISYITLFIFMCITAASQSDSEIIQNKLVAMGLDSSKLNSVQFSKQLLNTWSKSNYEENKYNPYIILPIKIWEQLFEIQNNKFKEEPLAAEIEITYATILIDLSKYEKALPLLEKAYLSKKLLPKIKFYKISSDSSNRVGRYYCCCSFCSVQITQ